MFPRTLVNYDDMVRVVPDMSLACLTSIGVRFTRNDIEMEHLCPTIGTSCSNGKSNLQLHMQINVVGEDSTTNKDWYL